MNREPLIKIINYLRERNVNVLFAAYIGSYGTEDWIEGSSDYDIFLVVSGNEKPRIPIENNVDLTIFTYDRIKSLRNCPIIIEIAYSKPLIDKIGLKKWCEQNITLNLVVKLLNRAEEKLRSMINDPNSHMGACPILLYSCIIEILLVLSYINKRKVTMKELEEN